MEITIMILCVAAGAATLAACISSLQQVVSGEGTIIGSGGYAIICLGMFVFLMYQVFSGMPSLLEQLA